jgi:hypothetical protein
MQVVFTFGLWVIIHSFILCLRPVNVVETQLVAQETTVSVPQSDRVTNRALDGLMLPEDTTVSDPDSDHVRRYLPIAVRPGISAVRRGTDAGWSDAGTVLLTYSTRPAAVRDEQYEVLLRKRDV